MPFRSLSPHLRPFGQNTYTKIKVEYPRGLPPAPGPLPSHWLRPWCKIGGKRVLLGMHIYKIYTKHERKNMKNAYRGGRTLKTPSFPTHTHMFFHVPLGISTTRDTTIIEVTVWFAYQTIPRCWHAHYNGWGWEA